MITLGIVKSNHRLLMCVGEGMCRLLVAAKMAFISTLFLYSVLSNAQVKKYPVEILHSGDDRVGGLYAFELKEAIRGSKSMQLVAESFEPRIKVSVVTIDADSSNRGLASAIAVTILYDSLQVPLGGVHLTTMIQICGRNRVTFCSRDLMSSIDAETNRLRNLSQSLWKTLF
jgi:hypothetical protein